MEKPKNLQAWPMDMNNGGGIAEGVGNVEWSGGKKEKKSGQL